VISAIISLTLSPALSAILLPRHGPRPTASPARWTSCSAGCSGLQPPVPARSDGYERAARVRSVAAGLALGVYVALLAVTAFGFSRLPSGFVPTQDKRYLVAFAQLPDAATLDRTTRVLEKMAEIGLQQPGVVGAVQFPGLSINGFVNATNAGIIFFTLAPSRSAARPRPTGRPSPGR
jgi:multidrug efflux pump subunit AcrB